MYKTPEAKTAQNNLIPFLLSFPTNGVMHFPILDASKSARMKSGLVNLHQGENVGSHNTGQCEELLIILDGIGEVLADGLGIQEVKKDSIVYIPPNNQHDVRNTGTAILKYIYIVSPTL